MKKVLITAFYAILFLAVYFLVGQAPKEQNIFWGVNFSKRHSEELGLNWKENYLAIMDDLGARSIKLAVPWNAIEPENNIYFFDDLDWQIREAQNRNVQILPVIGMKTPRWPECHIPEWAKGMKREDVEKEILSMLENVVSRYKDYGNIQAWQVENEPFFAFGECPFAHSAKFLKEEVALVKSIDSLKPIFISDSGEWSLWFHAATIGDKVGVTMYRKVWFSDFKRYVSYSFPSVYYWRRAFLIDKFFSKEVVGVELQAEPWGPSLLYYSPIEEQLKSMNLEQFQKNVEFAKNSGLSRHYFWGAEWWYWMKEKQNNPEIWNEARRIISNEVR